MSIKKLPHWVLVDKFPAFYDADSKTTIQQTAEVYGKMNELIESYNKFIDIINTEFTNYENSTNKDILSFEQNINKIICDYMYKIDTQIVHQNRAIDEVYNKFKNQMFETVEQLFNEMQDSGELETIIENAVSEFIDSLKSSLVSEVTTSVEVTMNTVVSNAKNDIDSAVNQGSANIENAVNEGINTIQTIVNNENSLFNDFIESAVDEGKEIISSYANENNILGFYPAYYNRVYTSDLPIGIHMVAFCDLYGNPRDFDFTMDLCWSFDAVELGGHKSRPLPIGSIITKYACTDKGISDYMVHVATPNGDRFIYQGIGGICVETYSSIDSDSEV